MSNQRSACRLPASLPVDDPHSSLAKCSQHLAGVSAQLSASAPNQAAEKVCDLPAPVSLHNCNTFKSPWVVVWWKMSKFSEVIQPRTSLLMSIGSFQCRRLLGSAAGTAHLPPISKPDGFGWMVMTAESQFRTLSRATEREQLIGDVGTAGREG